MEVGYEKVVTLLNDYLAAMADMVFKYEWHEGQILISANTLSHSDDEPTEPLWPMKVKGKHEAVNVFRLRLD